jgi:phenylpropionate dioxygenase-like ring-hydroxylating dioxygenase large terminal subunit
MNVDLGKIERGLIERAYYTSPDVYEAEQSKIFAGSWLFVAHRSEFKQPGDFRTMDLADQPVLAILGEDQKVRVFYNSCSHRGAVVETERQGHRDRFRCMYHHWEYGLRGELALVPRAEGYDGLRVDELGLVELPRVEQFEGLIFASLSKDVAPLRDYLGEAASYVAYLENYQDRKLEVFGCYDFVYKGNWKLLYENTHDDYHAQYLHAEAYRMPEYEYGKAYATQGQGKQKAAPTNREPKAVGMHSVLEWRDAPETLRYQTDRIRHLHVGIFPSFLGLYHPGWDVTNYRILRPEGVGTTRVHNYVLGPADMAPEQKKALAERFHFSYGPGGRIGLDDVRVFEHCQRGLRANAKPLVVTRGIHKKEAGAADEHNIRNFWSTWGRYMSNNAA